LKHEDIPHNLLMFLYQFVREILRNRSICKIYIPIYRTYKEYIECVLLKCKITKIKIIIFMAIKIDDDQKFNYLNKESI